MVIKVAAFTNTTTSTTRLAVKNKATNVISYSSEQFDNKSVEAVKTISLTLKPNKSYSLVKGDDEYMICYIELIEHFKI